MATSQSHFSFSIFISILYALGAVALFQFKAELVVLAAVLVVVAGMLPNIDQSGSNQARELGSLLAAIAPLICLELFPVVGAGGVPRIALVVVLCYLFTRLVIVRSLKKYTTHRGMIHSIPAAIIAAELTYLLFWDLRWQGKLLLASATLLGFMVHLFLDAYSNLDLVKAAKGEKEGKTPVLKFLGSSGGVNFVTYATMFILGWFVARDIYPNLGFYARVTY